MLMQTITCRTIEELSATAARILADKLRKIIVQKRKAIIAIPGGRSVAGIFDKLKTEDLPWGKIHIFWVDERKVDLDDKESNFKVAQDAFLGELIKNKKIPPANIHSYNYKTGANEYFQELEKYGGRFDVVLLSAGEDGHIASLFPKHDSFYDNSAGYIDVHNAPKPPPERISASRKLIQSAGAIMLLFAGKEKKKAYEEFVDENVSEEKCPAKLVKKAKEALISVLVFFK